MTQSRQSRAEGLAIGRYILNYTTIAIALLALGAFLCHACAHAEDLPDAPPPTTVKEVSPLLRSIGMRPIVKQDFLKNRTNLAIMGADITSRVILDPISTRQFMTDPCRCFYEKGDRLFGVLDWKSAANSFGSQAAFGAIEAGEHIGASWLLWKVAEGGNPYSFRGRHRRALEWAARVPMAYDFGNNLAYGFIHNELLISRGGAR